jgi:hypothetical protein
MNKKPLLTAILAVALVTMACGININLPGSEIKTGPTQTDEISVAMPDTRDTVDLNLTFGAGKIKLEPAEQDLLVSGTATYNVQDFKPVIETDENQVEIKQGDLQISGIPNFKNDIKNEWQLSLATNTPLNLKINAGAYSGRYELGGLELENLSITDGASDVNLNFGEPNLAEMTTLRYNTGASTVTLENLGNANFATLIFQGGAGTYKLDFNGELRQDAVVNIESGVSTIVLVVPEGTPAQVSFEGGLSNVQTFGDWDQAGDSYSQGGSGAELTFIVKMGAGTLELRNK